MMMPIDMMLIFFTLLMLYEKHPFLFKIYKLYFHFSENVLKEKIELLYLLSNAMNSNGFKA